MQCLLVCDFDDTLCKCIGTKIKICDKTTKQCFELTTTEIKNHKIDREKYNYDWSDFDNLTTEYVENTKLLDLICDWKQRFGEESIVILTSRSKPNGPKMFLTKHGFNNIKIVTLGILADDVEGKANWIRQEIIDKNLNDVHFYEDNEKFIESTQRLINEFPNIRFNIKKVEF